MNILITRPLIDSEDLMGKLFSLGHKIVHIPTLKISAANVSSVDAKKYKLEGAIKWGHGLLGQKKHFNYKIEGVSLLNLINNWVEKKKNTIFIKY